MSCFLLQITAITCRADDAQYLAAKERSVPRSILPLKYIRKEYEHAT